MISSQDVTRVELVIDQKLNYLIMEPCDGEKCFELLSEFLTAFHGAVIVKTGAGPWWIYTRFSLKNVIYTINDKGDEPMALSLTTRNPEGIWLLRELFERLQTEATVL